MLARTDVVHGTYYLLMLPWTRVAGTSELAMRLPSVLAMSAAAAGIAAIGARLISERAGLASGLAFALFPVASRYGQEARSYAFVMATAVLASYLLIRALESRNPYRWWMPYCATIAVLGWTNLMAFLILPAHALTVLGLARRDATTRRRVAVGWSCAAGAALAAVIPLLILAWPQREGTARFLITTTFDGIINVPGRLTGSWPVLVLAIPLVVLAVRSAGPREELAWLSLPWLLVPPVLLLVAGAISPLYDPRYILFCVPALALLAGAGLDSLASRASRAGLASRSVNPDRRYQAAAIACLAVIGLAGVPAQLSYRSASGHVDDLRLAARIVAANEKAGDAVLYQPPWWRQVSAAYPYGFDRLRDLSLQLTPAQAGNFTGVQLPVSQVRARLATVRRLWLVEFKIREPDRALGAGWHVVASWHPGTLVLVLYERQLPPHQS